MIDTISRSALQLQPTEQLSDTASNSPSLRATSTDAERELGYASSPSTGFTSFGEEEKRGNDGPQLAFSSNSTSPITRSHGLSSASSREHGTGSSIADGTARWKIPFAKASATPKPSSSLGIIAGPATSREKRKDSGRHDDDGNFVETTSAQAAMALAQYWNDTKRLQDANGKGKARESQDDQSYVVVAGTENGRTVYRIK